MSNLTPETFEQAANNLAVLLNIRPSAQEIIRIYLCKFAVHTAQQLLPECSEQEARAKALSIQDMQRASWNKEQYR